MLISEFVIFPKIPESFFHTKYKETALHEGLTLHFGFALAK